MRFPDCSPTKQGRLTPIFTFFGSHRSFAFDSQMRTTNVFSSFQGHRLSPRTCRLAPFRFRYIFSALFRHDIGFSNLVFTGYFRSLCSHFWSPNTTTVRFSNFLFCFFCVFTSSLRRRHFGTRNIRVLSTSHRSNGIGRQVVSCNQHPSLQDYSFFTFTQEFLGRIFVGFKHLEFKLVRSILVPRGLQLGVNMNSPSKLTVVTIPTKMSMRATADIHSIGLIVTNFIHRCYGGLSVKFQLMVPLYE